MMSGRNGTGRQGQLWPEAAFRPTPYGVGQYVVAVQSKKGEFDALQHLDASTWPRVTPLLLFLGPTDQVEPLTPSRVDGWAKRAASVVEEHPCFVDVLRLEPRRAVQVKNLNEAVISVLHRACRRRGMQFVPVFDIGRDGGETRDHIAAAIDEDAHGVCLRYPVGSIPPPGQTPQSLVARALTGFGLGAAEADLLLDLGWIDPDSTVDIVGVRDLIGGVSSIGAWRSLVLLGSSIPKTMGCVPEGQVGRLLRQEWLVWQEILASSTTTPTFGDYGIQHPTPPSEGGTGMRANVRYTAARETVVARGVGPVQQEGADQYRDLCREIVQCGDFCGRDYTWGDETIAGCAQGPVEPGGQSMWRGAGFSHHIRFVADQILSITGQPS